MDKIGFEHPKGAF